jgi:FixJ family two-component response regulator
MSAGARSRRAARPRSSAPYTLGHSFLTNVELIDLIATCNFAFHAGFFMSRVPVIACIDDDRFICEAMAGFLKASDFDADTYSSAEAFLQSDRLERTQCLVTDVKLPGMSGLDLQSRLTMTGHDIPIIIVTALPGDHLRERAFRTGAICFLSKPVTKKELLRCIFLALNSSSKGNRS